MRHRRGDQRGQAAVELALALPLVALLGLLVVQAGLVVRDQVLLVHAAREAAREAAVGAPTAGARAAAVARSGLEGRHLSVTIRGQNGRSGTVEARLGYRAPTDVPLVGRLLPPVALSATAAMRWEGAP